jgi:HPt (histidine-containing phosphotransfer) domain-containing protein
MTQRSKGKVKGTLTVASVNNVSDRTLLEEEVPSSRSSQDRDYWAETSSITAEQVREAEELERIFVSGDPDPYRRGLRTFLASQRAQEATTDTAMDADPTPTPTPTQSFHGHQTRSSAFNPENHQHAQTAPLPCCQQVPTAADHVYATTTRNGSRWQWYVLFGGPESGPYTSW